MKSDVSAPSSGSSGISAVLNFLGKTKLSGTFALGQEIIILQVVRCCPGLINFMKYLQEKRILTQSHCLFCLFGVEEEQVLLTSTWTEPHFRVLWATGIFIPSQPHSIFPTVSFLPMLPRLIWNAPTHAIVAFQSEIKTSYSNSCFIVTDSGSLNTRRGQLHKCHPHAHVVKGKVYLGFVRNPGGAGTV